MRLSAIVYGVFRRTVRFGPPPRGRLRATFDPLAHAFPAQAAAILDPAIQVALLCSGRAGKTTAFSLKWHHTRLAKPGRTSIFVALTRDHAKAILWQELKRQNEEWHLGLDFAEAELTARDSAGSVLRLLGANRDDLVDVLRGFPMVLAGFDEAAFVRRGLLERCVDDAVLIRLFDYGGQCWAMGTPGLTAGGYFHDITTGKLAGWSRHHWTLLENPHLPKTAAHLPEDERRALKLAWIAAEMKRKGWSEKSATYQREFLGQWASDPDAMVYPISERNVIKSMPLEWTTRKHEWVTVLGIDYGVTKATAHALLAWHPSSRAVFIVRSRRDNNISPSEAGAITQRWVNEEQPSFVIGDAGGLGKGFTQEAAYRFQLAIEPADKLNKRGHQEWVRDALSAEPAGLYVVEAGNEDLITEMEQLQWEPFPQGDPRWRLKEDPRGRKDLADAALYGYVKCYSQFPDEPPPPPGDEPIEAVRDDSWTRYLQ